MASVKEDDNFVILWHEPIQGKLGVDVTSSYITSENLCETDTVIFWPYNCAGQNKNWTIHAVLCWFVIQNWGPQSITTKYFERGTYTFIRADSVHHIIGRKMKQCPEICIFQDFVDVFDKSGAKVKPTVERCNDFYEFEDGYCNSKPRKITLPHLDLISSEKF